MEKLWENIKRWKYVIIVICICLVLYVASQIPRHQNILAAEKTDKTVDIEDAVKKALEELKNNQLIPDYEKHEKNIMEVLKVEAQKEATLTTKMVHMIDNKTMPEVEKEMSAIIGQERVDLIKKSFTIETYRMKVVKKHDDQSVAHVHRRGVEFLPDIMLISKDGIANATTLQWSSLVVEVFLFVPSCVGISSNIRSATMKAILKKVDSLVQEPAFQKGLNKLVETWKKAGGSTWKKAIAIFFFLKNSYSIGMFWKIIKLIFQNMSEWEKTRAIGEVALMIVATFTQAWFALIARFALAVDNTVYLGEKIANIIKFADMMKIMK